MDVREHVGFCVVKNMLLLASTFSILGNFIAANTMLRLRTFFLCCFLQCTPIYKGLHCACIYRKSFMAVFLAFLQLCAGYIQLKCCFEN